MTPAQLTAFATIARLGSVKAAAVELGVSEAAISSHTAALRRELQDPLYQRSGPGLSFTAGGLRLAARATELLNLQDKIRHEVAAADGARPTLRLTTTSLFGEWAAPGLVESFQKEARDLDVEMSQSHGDRLLSLLIERRIDVAVGPLATMADPRLRVQMFLRYELILVVGRHHPLGGSGLSPATLRNVPWLLGPSALEVGGPTSRIVTRFDVPERNKRLFQSHGAALSAVLAGDGVGALPSFLARDLIAKSTLRRISTQGDMEVDVWAAASLPPAQAPLIAKRLLRFVVTPQALRAMLTGSASSVGGYQPSLHVPR